MKNKTSKKKNPSVQKYLQIDQIREDAVILKDKTLRSVLAVSSINFALKSEDEQNALIGAYARFLNVLEYPVQIVIQSRKLNIEEYTTRLKDAEKKQINELLKIQIRDYTSFVKELVDLGDIMTKKFFVVIPYSPISDKRKNFWSRLYEAITPAAIVSLKEEKFQKYRVALMQRVGYVQSGLQSMGLQTQILDTQALIELYYRVYNPDIAESQKLQDISKIRTEESGDL